MDLQQALRVFLYAAVALVIFALLWWLVDYASLPSPFGHVLHVILVVLAVLVLIGFLLKLIGRGDITSGPPLP